MYTDCLSCSMKFCYTLKTIIDHFHVPMVVDRLHVHPSIMTSKCTQYRQALLGIASELVRN